MTARKPNPINVTRIDHVVLRVADMERMIAFYADVLGCRLERGPGENGLAQLRAGDSLIDLVDITGRLGGSGHAPDRNAPNIDHVCLQIQPWDESAVLQHLEEHDIQAGPTSSRYGAAGQGPSIYIEDPEGNRVELKAGA